MKKYISNFYLTTILFSILFLTFFIFVFFHASELILDRQIEILKLELSETEYEVSRHLNDVSTKLETSAFFIQAEPTDEELMSYLVFLSSQDELISSTYFGRPDKTMINSSGFIPSPEFDLTQRAWYQLAIASNLPIYSPAFLNASADKIIITIAYAVHRDHELLGVIASDINITSIRNVVSQRVIGDSGFSFLIDNNGNMVAHPKLSLVNLELTEASSLLNNLSHMTENMTHYNFMINGKTGVISHQYIFDGSYTLGVFIPNSEFYQSSRLFAFVFVLIIGSVISFVIILTYANRKLIFQPIQKLVLDIDTVNLENRPNYRIPIQQKSGFLEIRKAMNVVLSRTSDYFEQNHITKHNLTLENQRVSLLMNSTADIIFEIDLFKKYVTVVGKGLEKLGHVSESYTGKTVIELFGNQGIERDKCYDEALMGNNSYYNWQYQKDHQLLYFESSISPMYDENNEIIGAVGISRDITDNMEKQHEIEHINAHDFLTGLFNRRYFVEKLSFYDQEIYYPLGIVMMDLNGLKMLNDAYGHSFGDFALSEASNVFTTFFRPQDIVARIGGDEFAVIMPLINSNEIEEVKNNIKNELSKKQINNLQISVSIGYEIKKNHDLSIEEVMNRAENYMYRNKLSEGMSIRNSAIKAILQTLTDKYIDEREHLEKVSQMCVEFGRILSFKVDQLKELELAGMYHDIGKISIPDAILNKPGKLTSSEYDFMKTHVEAGYQILKAADAYSNLAEYALTHHEKWDGSGYPRGLKGEVIPLISRIISIVDAYDAMTSVRVYKDKMSEDDAVNEIIRCSGTQFDPVLAKRFVKEYLGKEWIETI